MLVRWSALSCPIYKPVETWRWQEPGSGAALRLVTIYSVRVLSKKFCDYPRDLNAKEWLLASLGGPPPCIARHLQEEVSYASNFKRKFFLMGRWSWWVLYGKQDGYAHFAETQMIATKCRSHLSIRTLSVVWYKATICNCYPTTTVVMLRHCRDMPLKVIISIPRPTCRRCRMVFFPAFRKTSFRQNERTRPAFRSTGLPTLSASDGAAPGSY
jgi:hypothetical protein